jgi:hypothetical protein
MEFLGDYIKKMEKIGIKLGAKKDDIRPWYNEEGDCIEFQTRHESVVADRIDNYLTIYRSAIDNKPIGYKIKDVRALTKKLGVDGLTCIAKLNNSIVLSIQILLMIAFKNTPATTASVEGYIEVTESFKSTPAINDSVQIPV